VVVVIQVVDVHIVVVWEDIPAAAAEDSTAEDILAVAAEDSTAEDIRAVDSAEDIRAVDSAEDILAVNSAEDILAVDSADIRAVDSAEDTLAVDSAENILANSDLTQSIHRSWILAFGRNAVDLGGTDLQLVLAVVAYYQQ